MYFAYIRGRFDTDCIMVSTEQHPIPEQFLHSQSFLQGKWHVVASNFPLWLESKNPEPCFHYSNFRMENNQMVFDDLVTYKKNGKEKKIQGTDTQASSEHFEFVWKGKGWLMLFKSRWKVLISDTDSEWMVIHSGKTLVSPAGVDVLSRRKTMSEKEVKSILSRIDASYGRKKMIQLVK
ncbi:MAG: lipocalin family protein [Bacteroidia bacterium]